MSGPPPAPSGYLAPPRGPGRPGVVVLHSWWGLDDHVRDACERLADDGYLALAPDLLDGATPTDVVEAEAVLARRSPDEMARTVMVAIDVVRQRSGRDGPVGIVGYAMGGSLALWAAARRPAAVAVAVAYYAGQAIDFDELTAEVVLHFAEHDDVVGDERVTTESFLRLGGVEPQVTVHPGTHHGFAEAGHPTHDPAASEAAWAVTSAALGRVLRPDLAGRPGPS